MESIKIDKWLKIIALWSLFTALLSTCFYILTQVGIIDEKITRLDLVEFLFNTIAGFAVFVGIWCLKSWGWKAAILLIPVSWILSAYSMAIDYYRLLGIFSSPFIIIDGFIMRYLFKDDVIELFQIKSSFLLKLKWCANGLFLMALFLIVIDIFGDIVAIVTILAIFMGAQVSRKIKTKQKESKI